MLAFLSLPPLSLVYILTLPLPSSFFPSSSSLSFHHLLPSRPFFHSSSLSLLLPSLLSLLLILPLILPSYPPSCTSFLSSSFSFPLTILFLSSLFFLLTLPFFHIFRTARPKKFGGSCIIDSPNSKLMKFAVLVLDPKDFISWSCAVSVSP